MALKHSIRGFAQKFGVDIVRYPLHDPLARTVQLLDHHRIDCVVDVGANDGDFATSIRRMGYAGRIISFEPLSKPFTTLRRKADTDDNWEAHQYAVGATTGDITINVSGNSGLSSSILPMLETHLRVAPNSRYVDTETVAQDRLDALIPKMGGIQDRRTFLKIDVQGYEAAVLDGATDLLAGTAIAGLQMELSLQPLYAGAMTYREGLDRAEALGMSLMDLSPVFSDPRSGRLLQADAVFFRQ